MTAWVRARRARARRPGLVLAAAVVAAAAGTGGAGADTPPVERLYSGSLQIASGEYVFAERTTSFYVVNAVDVWYGRLHLSASLPIVVQSTPWVTFAPVPIPSGGRQSGSVGEQIQQHAGRGPGGSSRQAVVILPIETVDRQAGVGDPVFRGGVSLLATSSTVVRANGVVKAPVAPYSDGLGTGEWDAGAGLSVERALGAHRVFGRFEVWHLGDLPDLVLKDAAMYQAGYEHVLGIGRWSALGSVSGWTTILDGIDPPVTVSAGIERRLSGARAIGLTAGVGLTETAPDVSVAFHWRLPF